MIKEFGTELTPLTARDTKTGRLLTATVYTVPGVEGTLSMGQLVMAICLSRAADVEESLVKLMGTIDHISDRLAALTQIQGKLSDWYETHSVNDAFAFALEGMTWSYKSAEDEMWPGKVYSGENWREFLTEVCGMTDEALTADSIRRVQVEDLVNSVGDTMDANNSITQDQLIQMQSDTSKRDQAYDMVTNILKSFNTELIGNAGNMR